MFPDTINLKKIVYTLKVRGGYFFLGGYGLAEKKKDPKNMVFMQQSHQ